VRRARAYTKLYDGNRINNNNNNMKKNHYPFICGVDEPCSPTVDVVVGVIMMYLYNVSHIIYIYIPKYYIYCRVPPSTNNPSHVEFSKRLRTNGRHSSYDLSTHARCLYYTPVCTADKYNLQNIYALIHYLCRLGTSLYYSGNFTIVDCSIVCLALFMIYIKYIRYYITVYYRNYYTYKL